MNERVTEINGRTRDLERRTTALEEAERLSHALDENTEALERVRRKYRWVMALVAVVAFTLLTVTKFNYDGNVSRCEGGNELRVEIDEKWDAISEFIEANSTDGISEAEREFLDLLTENLEPRNCNSINWLGQG